MHQLANHTAIRRAVPALALALLASGCATTKPKADISFPPPPDKARIKWVRSFLTEDDLNQSAWRKIWKALVPHDSTNALVSPTGLALSPDEKTLYAAVPHRRRVLAVDLAQGKMTAIGTSGGGLLNKPVGVAVDAQGLVYVSDKNASAVVVFAKDGSVVRKFGQEKLKEPTGIAVDRRAQLVYVVNDASVQEGRHTVEVFSLAGKHLRTMGGPRSPEPGRFNFPRSVAVSRTGELHVVDMLNFRVQVFDAQGRLVRMFGEAGSGFPGQFDKIHSIGFDAFDNVYVADAVQGVHILNADARPLMMFGRPVATAPSAIVVSSRNTIYVADLLHTVHEFQLVNTTAADSRAPQPSSSAVSSKPQQEPKPSGAAAPQQPPKPSSSTPATSGGPAGAPQPAAAGATRR
jgi:sugar lactone lactonase YvrE